MVGVMTMTLAIVAGLPCLLAAEQPAGVIDDTGCENVPCPPATARVRLLVQESSTTASGATDPDHLMDTCKAIARSRAVLNRALKRIPTAHCADLEKVPEEKRVGLLRDNLTIQRISGTNMLELQYHSTDAGSAAPILEAIAASYVDFVGQTQRSTGTKVLERLQKEKKNIEKQIREKQEELQRLQAIYDGVVKRISNVDQRSRESGLRVRVVEPPLSAHGESPRRPSRGEQPPPR
jgi:hypothetical protein